jgi:hypothetical protein
MTHKTCYWECLAKDNVVTPGLLHVFTIPSLVTFFEDMLLPPDCELQSSSSFSPLSLSLFNPVASSSFSSHFLFLPSIKIPLHHCPSPYSSYSSLAVTSFPSTSFSLFCLLLLFTPFFCLPHGSCLPFFPQCPFIPPFSFIPLFHVIPISLFIPYSRPFLFCLLFPFSLHSPPNLIPLSLRLIPFSPYNPPFHLIPLSLFIHPSLPPH